MKKLEKFNEFNMLTTAHVKKVEIEKIHVLYYDKFKNKKSSKDERLKDDKDVWFG